ncbi:MAG: DUF4394 domain-containing protein [Sphingobacteriales bacterium]|nr:MAG: DUF4394 domain-containing protein [Sphingobacteriales bacterium]
MLSKKSISGLESGEKILAIDFRPATGQLYAVGDNSRLYTINPETALARQVGTMAFSPAIQGTLVGFDFNPTVDRIRLVTNSGQNLRLNPETGGLAATDGMLNPGSPMVISAAYTNSFAGAAATTLFDIDLASQKLVKQTPPNNGTLVPVGSLGVVATGEGGFDISPDNKAALAALTIDSKSSLYLIDTLTGKAQKLGIFAHPVIGIAIPTNPVAYSVDHTNNLLIFNMNSNAAPVSKVIAPLQAGETILGIDMRPATGQLYALGSTSRIYSINMSNGMATVIGTMPFSPALSGTSFGFDFNPTVDRIRVVSNTGQNLRLHPETGVVAVTDKPLNPGTPMISGVAYTNNYAGATTTTLYDLDFMSDKLFMQAPPNDGTLVAVSSLNANIDANNGFDIGGQSNKGYILSTSGMMSKIYSINLSSGKASLEGNFPAAGKIVSGEHWLDDEGRRIQVQCPATIDACIQPVHPSQK